MEMKTLLLLHEPPAATSTMNYVPTHSEFFRENYLLGDIYIAPLLECQDFECLFHMQDVIVYEI